ncbi:MAG: MATE family efflux transporter [Dehalococcoidia bacterium]|nr:MATE family efflux transporter [Dehalococcoidia bacterium]
MPPDDAETLAAPPAVIDEANLFRSVLRLAWPVVIQQVSFSMVQLVDTALVGHLGENALAGVRLAGQIFWFSQAGMVAVAVGSTAVIARNVGAGQPQLASRTLQNAFLIALAWGLVMGILMWFFGHWGLGMLGAEEGAKHQGTVYLKAAAVGMPLWSLVYAGSASLQGAGDTRAPMVIGVVVNIVNIIVAYLLINGAGPFPRLEVLGSGAGFTSAAIIGAALVLLVLASGTRIIHWRPWEAFQFDPVEARRVLNVGLPAGAEQIQFNIAFMIYTRIIASLGTAALAAHGVTLAIQSLTFNIGFALSVATTALVGQSLGAGRPDLAERATYVTMRYSLVFMMGLGVIMMVFGGNITGLFVGGENADEVIHIGRQLLFIFAFAMPGLAVSLSLGGGLRGAGDTRAVLVISAAATWIVRLVPAYLLAITAGLGVPGAWAAAIADINMRALLIFIRFRRGRWKRMKV